MNSKKTKIANICDKVSLFSLCAIAFFLPISKAIIEVFSILAIISYLLRKFVSFKALPKTPLNLPLFIYLFICIISIFMSSNPKISTRTFFSKTLQDVAFFFVVAETLSSKRRLKNILSILFLSSLVLGIDGLYQYFTRKDFLRNRPLTFSRIYASFVTANAFGCYLTMVIPFLISRFFSKFRIKVFRFIYFALFILLFICLLLTASRGAWLAFLTSGLFMSIWLRGLNVFLIVLGIFVLITHIFYPSFVKEKLIKFFVFSDTSSIERKFIWQTGWKMFVSRPLIGVGLGTFMFNFKKFIANDYKYAASYAHNCYLQMASEIGLIGLAAFLLILASFFHSGIKALNTHEKKFSWYVLLASLAAISGYCVHMAVDTILYSLDLGMLFWLVLGIGVAALKNIEADSKNTIKQANV